MFRVNILIFSTHLYIKLGKGRDYKIEPLTTMLKGIYFSKYTFN